MPEQKFTGQPVSHNSREDGLYLNNMYAREYISRILGEESIFTGDGDNHLGVVVKDGHKKAWSDLLERGLENRSGGFKVAMVGLNDNFVYYLLDSDEADQYSRSGATTYSYRVRGITEDEYDKIKKLYPKIPDMYAPLTFHGRMFNLENEGDLAITFDYWR